MTSLCLSHTFGQGWYRAILNEKCHQIKPTFIQWKAPLLSDTFSCVRGMCTDWEVAGAVEWGRGPWATSLSSLEAALLEPAGALSLVGPKGLRIFLCSCTFFLSTLLIKVQIGHRTVPPSLNSLNYMTLSYWCPVRPSSLLPSSLLMPVLGIHAHASPVWFLHRDLTLTIPPLEKYWIICEYGHTVNFEKQIKCRMVRFEPPVTKL